MKKLWIHTGFPKTGTTFLQKFIASKRDDLAKAGILYPSSIMRGYGHHDIALLLNGDYPDWAIPQDKTLEQLFDELAEECQAFDGDILISSENFSLFPQPALLKDWIDRTELAKDREISLIFYLRRQDDLMESWYNQMVKAQGYAGKPDQAIAQMDWMDYAAQIANWEEAFGPKTVKLYRYEDALVQQGGLLSHFLNIIGPALDHKDQLESGTVVNSSLPWNLLEIQRLINKLPLSTVRKRMFHHDFMALAQKHGGKSYPSFNNQTRKTVMARFDAGNKRIAQTYFKEDELYPLKDNGNAPKLTVFQIIKTMAHILRLKLARTIESMKCPKI